MILVGKTLKGQTQKIQQAVLRVYLCSVHSLHVTVSMYTQMCKYKIRKQNGLIKNLGRPNRAKKNRIEKIL